MTEKARLRPTVRAVILHQDGLVLLKRVKGDRTYYVFPGGGVEGGEANEQALVREVKEEVGVEVVVERPLIEAPFKGQKGEKMEYFYRCRIVGGEVGTGQGPELLGNGKYEGSFEIQVMPWEKIPQLPIFPEPVKEYILQERTQQKAL